MKSFHLTKRLALVSLLAPATGLPLTIGDIEINSGLNQQLNAEIPLNLDFDETPGSIKVKMASASSFADNHIRWRDSLNKIQVTRIGSTVKISSKNRITDPALDFLLEINTPNGPKFRHYKIVFDHQASRNEIMTTSVEPSKIAKSDKVEKAAIDKPAQPAPSYEQRINAKGEFGPIQKTDTLWQIANYLAKVNGVSSKKMLAGLRDANPDAFYNRNKGSLKTGAYLQIPDFKNPPKVEAETKVEASKVVENKIIEPPVVKQDTPTVVAPTVPAIDTAQLQTRVEQLEHQVEQLQKDLAKLQTPQPLNLAVLPEPVAIEPALTSEIQSEAQQPITTENTNPEILYISLAAGLGVSVISFLAWLRFRKPKPKATPASQPIPEIETQPNLEETVTETEDEFELGLDNLELSNQEEDLLADMDAYIARGQKRPSEEVSKPEPESEPQNAEQQPEPEIAAVEVDAISNDIDISPGNDDTLNDQAIDDFEFDFDFDDSRRPSKKAKAFKNELDQARYESNKAKPKK